MYQSPSFFLRWISLLVDVLVIGHGRRKRHHWITNIKGCNGGDDVVKFNACLKSVGPFKIKLSCKYDVIACYYIAKCKHVAPTVAGGKTSGGQLSTDKWLCTKIEHKREYLGICCSPIC